MEDPSSNQPVTKWFMPDNFRSRGQRPHTLGKYRNVHEGLRWLGIRSISVAGRATLVEIVINISIPYSRAIEFSSIMIKFAM